MPTIAGLRGTGDWGTNERPTNFREMILWLDPNGEAPLTALMAKMSKEITDDPRFAWFEETQGHVEIVATGEDAVDTTIETAAGALALVAGDLLQVVPTDGNSLASEVLEVSATPTLDTEFEAVRGAANSTAAVIPASAVLLKIGNVFAEGTTSPDVTSRNPDELYNYTQIFKNPYELTGTAQETKLRTGDPLSNDKKRKMFDHSRDLELAFLFGRRHMATGANGKPKRYTNGLNQHISTNRTAFGSGGDPAFTEDNFIDALSALFNRRGQGAGDERIAFCGNGALTNLNKLARNSSSTRVNFDGIVKTYGMNLQKWVIPQGTLYLRTHPLMNIQTVYTNSMFVINPRGIVYRPMKGRDTKFQDNIQPNDADTRKGQWMTEAGVEVHHESTMGFFSNMIIP